MKRHLYFLWMLLLFCNSISGQSGEFNPSNPAEPVALYNLNIQASPSDARNSSGGQYAEGASVSLSANANTGFRFKSWQKDGNVVSTSSTFNYTMPAENVTLTAVFEYNPSNPAEPDGLYSLNLQALPNDAGSFSGFRQYAAGTHVSVSANANTGFRFKSWQEEEGNIISTSSSFSYTMPKKNVTLTAVFEYDPNNPAEPDPGEQRLITSIESLNFENKVIGITDFLSLTVRAQNLKSPLEISLTGTDSLCFETAVQSNWDNLTGGSLRIYFNPDEIKEYNANLILSSGGISDTIPLKGKGVQPTEYTVTATVADSIFTSGDSIAITGIATFNNQTIAANMNVNVCVEVIGYKRVLTATSNEAGEYEVIFVPQKGESGHYKVSAYKPYNVSSTIQAQFDIPGMKLASNDWILWEVEQDIPKTGTVAIMNRSAIALNNVRIETILGLPNAEFSFDNAQLLDGSGTVYLNYTVTGTGLTTTGNWEEIKLRAVSDEGIHFDFSIYFYCRPVRGVLETNPAAFNMTMTRGKSRIVEFELYNNGIGETGNISLSIPDVDWMELINQEIPSLAANDTARISLRLTPTESTPLNVPFNGNIAINCENGNSKTIPFTIEAVSGNTGTLLIDVVDEYYYNTAEAPHLANARVKVTHPYSFEVVAEGITNENGIFTVDLPEGYYTLFIEADKHESYRNNILIEAEKILSQQIFISFQAITYSWRATPMEIEDKYKIELITKFETNVPIPVVIMGAPDSLPELEEGEEHTFTITLTNKGLITAQGVTIKFPELIGYQFSVLMENIDSLPALQSIEIPVLMTRTNSTLRSATRACKIIIKTTYYYYCGTDAKWKEFHKTIETIGNNCDDDSDDELWRPNFDPSPDLNPICPVCSPTTSPVQLPVENPDEECKPCEKVIVSAILGCTMSFSEVPSEAQCAITGGYELIYDYHVTKKKINGKLLAGYFGDYVICVLKSKIIDAAMLIPGAAPIVKVVDIFSSCVGDVIAAIKECTKKEYELRSSNTDVNPFESILNNLEQYQQYLSLMNNSFLSIFPQEKWGEIENLDEFAVLFFDNLNSLNMIDEEGIENVISLNSNPDILVENIREFAERWNRSVVYWEEGYNNIEDLPEGYNPDFITINSFYLDEFNQIREYYIEKGYANIEEMVETSMDYLKNYVEQKSNSVCASVSLQIDQKLAMTREAFRGTLAIHNGHESVPMRDVTLNLVIKDAQGNNSNHLFHIETESLKTLTGVNGTGELSPQSDGTATILFIPTVNAALTESKIYSFGGTISYLDPFSDTQVTADLFPVALEVQPSPNLRLHYFVQRDIFGDDALTEPVEPSIPAELAVMIDNKGYGTAKNLTIESAQPKIIDNEKGLLIDFSIIGSSLNGQNRQLGLTDIHFGNMPGRSQMVGHWWFTSSLLGHFTEYESRVRHLDSKGNPDLSLVDTVEIHELIRSITAYGNLDDGIADFLVNDIPDANDYPDAIYFSNATKTNVAVADTAYTDGIVTKSNPVINLAVKSSDKGWNFARLNDPGQEKFRLVKITRADNQEIPLTNVWQTRCTLPDGGEPVYENKLHFVDTFSMSGLVHYTLEFEEINTNPLQVDSIAGIPVTIINYPLEKTMVHFNKPVYQPTFSWRDMELRVQGGSNLMDSTVTTTWINDSTCYVNFAAKTQFFGYYTFTVHTNEIYDLENLPGELGKQAGWIQQVSSADTIINQTICEGDSYNFNGKILAESGVYRDTLSSISGCDSIIVLNLIVSPNPIVNLGGNRNVSWDETVTLDAGDGESYMWKTGENTRTITVENTGDDDMISIWVQVSSADNCTGSDTIQIIYQESVDLDKNLTVSNESIKVFPNPTSGKINILFSRTEWREVALYDMTGKEIYRKQHDGKEVVLDFSYLPNAAYILKIDNRQQFKVIIVQ